MGEQRAPKDAKVVEYTWRYVNKRGGPDRRFSNNPQLPTIETRDVILTTNSGFHAQLKFSNTDAAQRLADQLNAFASKHEVVFPAKSWANAGDVDARKPEHRPIRPPGMPLAIPILLWALVCAGVGLVLLNSVGPHVAAHIQRQFTDRGASDPNGGIVLPTTVVPSSSQTKNVVASVAPSPLSVSRSQSFQPAEAAAVPGASVSLRPAFVNIVAPTAIKTPTGRVTLGKGMRLPVSAATHNTVTVRYFDGRDYDIPISATDHR